METTTKPMLEVSRYYQIELYPREEKVTGRYLGEREGEHVFVNEEKGEKKYLFVRDHWMIEKNGRITYIEISSAVISQGTKDDIKRCSKVERGRLTEILSELGEKI